MSQVVEKQSCASRGKGKPDYSQVTTPTKPILADDQEQWSDLWTTSDDYGGRLDPGTLIVTMYTVPEGYNLHLGGGVVSCEASCIQNIALVATPGILGDFRFDMMGQIVLSPDSAHIISGGTALMFILYNNDEVARHFSVSLVGVLEKVAT
jgi:hypothetical protein